MIISIDQSLTATGVCLIHKDHIITKLITTTAATPWYQRMDYIISNLIDFFTYGTETLLSYGYKKDDLNIEAIVMENYAYAGSSKGFVLGELGGIIKYSIWKSFGIQIPQIVAAHHKMYIAHNGHAQKSDTIKGLKDKFGIECEDDNIADAVSMGLLMRDMLVYEQGKKFSKYDTELFKRVRSHISGEYRSKKKKGARKSAGQRTAKNSSSPESSVSLDPFRID